MSFKNLMSLCLKNMGLKSWSQKPQLIQIKIICFFSQLYGSCQTLCETKSIILQNNYELTS